MTSEQELLPCPWPECGSTDLDVLANKRFDGNDYVPGEGSGAAQGYVSCWQCGAQGPKTAHYSWGADTFELAIEKAKSEAVKLWNERPASTLPTPTAFADLIERLDNPGFYDCNHHFVMEEAADAIRALAAENERKTELLQIAIEDHDNNFGKVGDAGSPHWTNAACEEIAAAIRELKP